MSVPGSLKTLTLMGLGLAFAASITVSPAMAQIGPIQPPKRPVQETKVTKAIEKLLGKKKPTDPAQQDQQPKVEDEPVNAPEEEATKQPPKDFIPGVVAIPERGPMLSQPPLTTAKIESPQVDPDHPPIMDHPKLDDPTNPLGLVDAQNRLKKFVVLTDAHRYVEAKPGLVQLRQWLVDMTEAHIGLYKTLNQIPSARAQAELEKTLALEFAQLRDRAMVEMAKIHIADKDYTKAVKELTDVVKSQPKSKVGLRSYEMLQEIGFTEKLQLAQ